MAARVVVAEDEWLAAAVLCHQIEQLGYEVVGAVRTGEEALALSCSQHPDLVLMDVQMPGMDGIAATPAVMEQYPTCVVIVTGRERLEEAAERAGAMGYLMKPVLSSQLAPAVEAARHRFGHFMLLRKEATTPQQALATWLLVLRLVSSLVGREAITEDQAFHQMEHKALGSGGTLKAVAREMLTELLR